MEAAEERVPLVQDFIDDIYLTFLISALVLFLGHGLWGVIDYLRIPIV